MMMTGKRNFIVAPAGAKVRPELCAKTAGVRGEYLPSGVDDGNAGSPGEKRDAKRRAKARTPRQVLLGRHRGGKYQHPADAAHADDERHEHQRPAAADAEQPVHEAERETFA